MSDIIVSLTSITRNCRTPWRHSTQSMLHFYCLTEKSCCMQLPFSFQSRLHTGNQVHIGRRTRRQEINQDDFRIGRSKHCQSFRCRRKTGLNLSDDDGVWQTMELITVAFAIWMVRAMVLFRCCCRIVVIIRNNMWCVSAA